MLASALTWRPPCCACCAVLCCAVLCCVSACAVLIDEAGQASEVAALQPLVFGAKRCAHACAACCLRMQSRGSAAVWRGSCCFHGLQACLLPLDASPRRPPFVAYVTSPVHALRRRVVLVGDPQQLPATILSELAKQVPPADPLACCMPELSFN